MGNIISLRERISELLQEHGTFRAVSEVVGIDHAYLNRLHRGEKMRPKNDVLEKLGLRRLYCYERVTATGSDK